MNFEETSGAVIESVEGQQGERRKTNSLKKKRLRSTRFLIEVSTDLYPSG